MARPPKHSPAEQIAQQAACHGCILRGWAQLEYYFGATTRASIKRELRQYRLWSTDKGKVPVLSVDAYRQLVTESQIRKAKKPVPPTEAANLANMKARAEKMRARKAVLVDGLPSEDAGLADEQSAGKAREEGR